MNSDEYPQLDVIAVGAHPDDVEIGCGGTVAKLVKQGYRVGIIDLTDGEPTPASSGPEQRMEEALAAAEALGVQLRVTLDMPNRKLFDSYEARVKLAVEFRKYRPRLVLGLGEKTPMASPDHWQAMQITDAAIFYSRLTKWDLEFTNLPPHSIAAQVYYTLESHRAEPLHGAGPMVIDISDTLAQKIASVHCYKSQFPPEKQYIFPRIEAIARQLGFAAGFEAGELLVSARAVGVRNLMDVLFES